MNEECDITEKIDADSPCAPTDESEVKPLAGVDCPSSGVNLLLGLLPLSSVVINLPLLNIWAPWIAWLCVRKKNPASRPAFRSVMNMQISWILYGFSAAAFILAVGVLSLMICSSSSFSHLSQKGAKMFVESCEAGSKGEGAQCEKEAGTKGDVAKTPSPKKLEKIDGEQKISIGDKGMEFEGTGDLAACSGVLKGMAVGMGAGMGISIFVVCWVLLYLILFIILLFCAGWIVWLGLTILFAIRVKNDVNAKPPLTIRFLK